MKKLVSAALRTAYYFGLFLFIYSILLIPITAVSASLAVKPPVVLPSAVANPDGMFEYCILTNNSRPAAKAEEGTPVPSEAVLLSTPVPIKEMPTLAPQMTESAIEVPQTEVPTSVPITVPSIAPTSVPEYFSAISVSHVGNFANSNWHFVLVGVGFDPENNPAQLENSISSMAGKFQGIRADFSYIAEPINIGLNRVQNDSPMNIDSRAQEIALFLQIKAKTPIDTLVIMVNSSEFLGLSGVGNGGFTLFSTGSEYSRFGVVHEMGHQLGMQDGYRDFYNQIPLPNNELFFADSMPRSLADAVKELGSTPPMYLMGTCKGKNVYSFSPYNTSIYGDIDWDPAHMNNLTFTSLQKIEMNDYVKAIKGN